MHQIDMQKPTKEFLKCWSAAGQHIQGQSQGPLSWLKADPTPPVLEHFSFRMGNQLFFVRVEDAKGKVASPGTLEGLLNIAHECNGHPCFMPMKRSLLGAWSPDYPGWGLIHAETGKPIIPPALVTEEQVEMTDWEVHDFAIQVVRDALEKQGHKIMSTQSNPKVDPSIWFVGDSGPEWILVRATRYPQTMPNPPVNIHEIASNCASMGKKGHFAPVGVAPADGQTTLWRGHEMIVRFRGLQKVFGI